MIFILLFILFFGSQQTIQDHSPKLCKVTQVVIEGTLNDCNGWKPVKGERMIMPEQVNKQLQVGDLFFFVFETDKWIAQLFLNGKAISLPLPAYPPIARAAHASGTVVVQVLIDENGNVISAHAVSGHPILQGAAVGAARQARFSPTKLSGVIQYNFVAQ